MRKILLLAGATAAAVVLASTARADDTDDAYLQAMHDHGISGVGGDSDLINYGHKVCNALATGLSMNALIDSGDLHEHNGISDDDVKFMVKTAAASYCPEYIQ